MSLIATKLTVAAALVPPAAYLAEGITVSSMQGIAVVVAAGGVITFLFRALITSKDKEAKSASDAACAAAALAAAQYERALAEVTSVKKSYQEIAAEMLKAAAETTNFYRQKEGFPPIVPLAPVVSESHSPSTEAQRETAMIQTMRAAAAQLKLSEGQEPRKEPEHAKE